MENDVVAARPLFLRTSIAKEGAPTEGRPYDSYQLPRTKGRVVTRAASLRSS